MFILQTEYLWHNEAITAKSSVVEMALSQPVTTAPLIRHHMILVVLLHAVMFYNLKSVKPLSLFDFKAREAFFQDFTLHPVLSILDLDQTVIRNRNQVSRRGTTSKINFLKKKKMKKLFLNLFLNKI